jgi:hypothetical protein
MRAGDERGQGRSGRERGSVLGTVCGTCGAGAAKVGRAVLWVRWAWEQERAGGP